MPKEAKRETYRIISKRHLNLHTSPMNPKLGDVSGGLVHVPAGVAVTVPASVDEHPAFDMLQEEGVITVLRSRPGSKPPREAEPLAPTPQSIKQQLKQQADAAEAQQNKAVLEAQQADEVAAAAEGDEDEDEEEEEEEQEQEQKKEE